MILFKYKDISIYGTFLNIYPDKMYNLDYGLEKSKGHIIKNKNYQFNNLYMIILIIDWIKM